jgi:hypothetical protein
MAMPGSMPISLSAGGGGPSGSSSNAGVQTPISTPFNFDGSGWVINFGDGNEVRAAGNTGANQTQQTPESAGGGASSGLIPGIHNQTLVIAAVVLFLMMRKK